MDIKTASNLQLTSKAIYATDTLSVAEREAMLKTLKIREQMRQTPDANLRQAIEKLSVSLGKNVRF